MISALENVLFVTDHTPNRVRIKGALLLHSDQLRIINAVNSESVVDALLHWDLVMYHLKSVEYLNLMQNNLQSIGQTFPQYLPNLTRIQLSANPWKCDR